MTLYFKPCKDRFYKKDMKMKYYKIHQLMSGLFLNFIDCILCYGYYQKD